MQRMTFSRAFLVTPIGFIICRQFVNPADSG